MGSDTIEIGDISDQWVQNAIKTLKPKAAVGIGGIPDYFSEAYWDSLKQPLTPNFNLSQKENRFPSFLRISKVNPIHRDDVRNYRAMTILSAPSELFEQVIYNRVYNHVDPVRIDQHHRFIRNKSTITNLCVFSNFVTDGMKNG
ncbi:hypothetical protein JTB14_011136 [Gonioctena quinquepunctata]|nr:hypothetical protein JTB14_011136 [Gonioctena quinquepunctata]